MTNFQNTLAEDRRLSILLVLAQTPGYSANAFLVRDAIQSIYGHNASTDLVSTDVAWLAEQALVTSRAVGSVTLATLTTRGMDVAEGRASTPGVKRRMP